MMGSEGALLTVWSVLTITKLQPLIPTAAVQIAVPFHVQGFIIQSASVEGEAFEKRARMKREPSVKFKWAGLELGSMQQNYLLCARTLLCHLEVSRRRSWWKISPAR